MTIARTNSREREGSDPPEPRFPASRELGRSFSELEFAIHERIAGADVSRFRLGRAIVGDLGRAIGRRYFQLPIVQPSDDAFECLILAGQYDRAIDDSPLSLHDAIEIGTAGSPVQLLVGSVANEL